MERSGEVLDHSPYPFTSIPPSQLRLRNVVTPAPPLIKRGNLQDTSAPHLYCIQKALFEATRVFKEVFFMVLVTER